MCDWSEVLFEEDRHRPHNHLSWNAGRSLISSLLPWGDFHSETLYKTAIFLIFSHKKKLDIERDATSPADTHLIHKRIHTRHLHVILHGKKSS